MDNMVYVMVLLNCAIGICALAIFAISLRINASVEQFIREYDKNECCCWKYSETVEKEKEK